MPYFIARYDSTLFRLTAVSSVGYMMTSPTFARTELLATVLPIPILDQTNGVVTAVLISVWSPLVRFVAVPPAARVVVVISAVPAHRPFAPL